MRHIKFERSKYWILVSTAISLAFVCGIAGAATVDDKLASYRAQGAGPFDANAGKLRWLQQVKDVETGKDRACIACHGEDLRRNGKHAKTGKLIEPLSPAVNPERLADAKKIDKWFKRNCKWTWGRECTPQEKGDFLVFIQQQ